MWSASAVLYTCPPWLLAKYNTNILFFACSRFLIFHPYFQGVSWPHLPLCADARGTIAVPNFKTRGLVMQQPLLYRLFLRLCCLKWPAADDCSAVFGRVYAFCTKTVVPRSNSSVHFVMKCIHCILTFERTFYNWCFMWYEGLVLCCLSSNGFYDDCQLLLVFLLLCNCLRECFGQTEVTPCCCAIALCEQNTN